jgi:hypothetical protein
MEKRRQEDRSGGGWSADADEVSFAAAAGFASEW